MNYKRSSGIILHPTSLPGPDGIGDLGPEAYRWINFLADCGCGLWQVLPLGPTGYGDSPYQCFSAFAGNPYLISPTLLMEEGLLTRQDMADRPFLPAHVVNYGDTIQWKLKLLDRAYERYKKQAPTLLQQELAEFEERESFWLDDYSLFMAIKNDNGGVAWNNWPEPLRTRNQPALEEFRASHAREIESIVFRQFLFSRQWQAVRKYANSKNIRIIGDIPIFVAYDSSDAWANRELFYIDPSGQPTVVAGVPPDYFSPTGQLWGNPLYKWEAHRKTGYAWWIKRIETLLKTVDLIRLDHFRGFAGYWEVPAGNPTAEIGRWVQGPGADLFNAIQDALGALPILAEDLGEISPDVFELRDHFNLPGMKVLQFAWLTDPGDPFLPHNFIHNCVVYTGTHDNDTTVGWYNSAPEPERDFCRRYIARSGDDIAWDLIRLAWSSIAVFALAPMQDLLSLGGEARMNFPGRPSGNWTWRLPPDALTSQLAGRMKEVNELYRRTPVQEKPKMTPKPIPYAEAED